MRRSIHRIAINSASKRNYSTQLTFNKYPFLEQLGLGSDNDGVCFDKQWTGSKDHVITSYNPSTGEAIARVNTATLEHYNSCVEKIQSAKREWSNVGINFLFIFLFIYNGFNCEYN